MLNAVELTSMRYDAELLLPSTCTIQTLGIVADGHGGMTKTWMNTYTSVACRLAPVQQSERTDASGGQFTVHSAWHLSVPYDQAIVTNNRVIYASDTYEVMQVDDDHDFRVLRRATLRRVDP